MKKIWCLFSVANDYDQPDNNLVRWWAEKPTIETLAKFLATPLASAQDDQIVAVVTIWGGKPARISANDTMYRLEEVAEAPR